jgi:hypothetical protein
VLISSHFLCGPMHALVFTLMSGRCPCVLLYAGVSLGDGQLSLCIACVLLYAGVSFTDGPLSLCCLCVTLYSCISR